MVMMMEKELSCNLTMDQQQYSITGSLPRCSEGSCRRESLILDQHTSLSLFIRLSLCSALPSVASASHGICTQTSTHKVAASRADDIQGLPCFFTQMWLLPYFFMSSIRNMFNIFQLLVNPKSILCTKSFTNIRFP